MPAILKLNGPLRKPQLLLRKNKAKEIPVMSAETIKGLITESDIRLLLGPDFDYPSEKELTVEDAYISNPLIVDINDSLAFTVFQLAKRKIGTALVTEHGKLIGIFTNQDACRCLGEYLITNDCCLSISK